MWFRNEELYPRFLRSILWMMLVQNVVINICMLVFKILSWSPVYSLTEWILCAFHWKTVFYQIILALAIVGFGVLNIRFCAVEKHISSTRFEKFCRALSPYCLQHVFATMFLGGIATYCCIGLFHNFKGSGSFVDTCLLLTNNFEVLFVTGHGCFTGMMFSLKYFICNLYLIKFTLDQEPKKHYIKRQVYGLLKESVICALKSVHWYYLAAIIFGSSLKFFTATNLGDVNNENGNIIYSLVNPKLFIVAISTGIMVSFLWSLYLIIFNAFATEHYKFPIKVPTKKDKNKTLASALTSNDFGFLKYLAVLDLRILAQCDPKRREHIFAISNPGGHPHEWKSISGICITSLQDFTNKVYEFSFAAAASSEAKSVPVKTAKVPFEKLKQNGVPGNPPPSFSNSVYSYFREKPVVSYFLDELPNSKLRKLFATSLPFIWMVDALGYLVTVSYTEDKFGVVQQSLPEIIRLLLNLKMAEEKMPIGLVGIRTYVKDPQGRYEHIHQRLSLKNTVHNALCRIANTFKEDINGIYLPEEYQKYFQRYLQQRS